MRFIVLILLMIASQGCTPEKRNNVNACRMDADRFYQGYQVDDVDNPRSRYIISCMAAKGYEFDISPTDCDSKRSLATQSTCYVSTGWAARILDRLSAQ
jgi:hypothetical protein